jgi:methionyl-tRNA synthetase
MGILSKDKEKPFYITTTLPYVNAEPHMGHALEFVRADIIARFKKGQGYDVFFNTGTDEHGQKLFESAKEAGIDVVDFVNQNAHTFKGILPKLGMMEDINFIRTTDEKHIKAVEDFWNRVYQNGFIYKKNYKTKYCVGCEENKTESELENGRCPIHPNREIEDREEENYFFKFSEFGDKLLELYDRVEKDGRSFVIPSFRLNEMREFIKGGLQDFSISRLKSNMSWGIPVPNDKDHVIYVWFDALVNYISTLGWPDDEKFEKFWVNGTPVQYCGKDNTRFQAVMWQAMLIAAGVPNSHAIIVNGFITGEGGIKMSKSLGNVVNPIDIVNEYSTDALRYFFAREVASFEDSPFTMERFKDSYNSGLANGLGNLVSRTIKMAVSYDAFPKVYEKDWLLEHSNVNEYLEKFEIKSAIDEIWGRISTIDKWIQDQKPFQEIKTNPEKAIANVEHYINEVYRIATELGPFMPETSAKILNALEKREVCENLFPRKD